MALAASMVDQLEDVGQEVRRLADAVGLRGHTFAVTVDDLPEGELARCVCADARAFSEIVVDYSFFQLPEHEQKVALVHEILHPLLHPLMRHVEDLREVLGRRHFEMVERVFRRDLERATDILAHAVAELLPG